MDKERELDKPWNFLNTKKKKKERKKKKEKKNKKAIYIYIYIIFTEKKHRYIYKI